MRIIVVGGTGTIGTAVVQELKLDHEVVAVGHTDGDHQVNIADATSIEQLYKKVVPFDALVATVGNVHFGPLSKMTASDYYIGLDHKLMGQIKLVLIGLKYINDHGSFTLTSGILNQDPIKTGSSAAMVNGALDSFVKAACLEMPRNIRINIVSPTVLLESIDTYGPYFPGYIPVAGSIVAKSYRKSLEGAQTGQMYKVGY